MTVQILRSHAEAASSDFAAAAAAFAVEMGEWRAHMKRVAEDEAKGVEGIDRHWPVKRPSAHPLVESAVNENSAVDYQLVEDGPSPEDVLTERKHRLLLLVSAAEQAAVAAVIPPAKVRLAELREQSILAADAARAARAIAEAEGGVIGKVFGHRIDIEQLHREQRPADDTRHLEEQAERRRRIAAIAMVAAQAHSDIDDLTAETIDGWQMPDFSSL